MGIRDYTPNKMRQVTLEDCRPKQQENHWTTFAEVPLNALIKVKGRGGEVYRKLGPGSVDHITHDNGPIADALAPEAMVAVLGFMRLRMILEEVPSPI